MKNKETLEEAADNYIKGYPQDKVRKDCFIEGAKWMQERMYSEEDMKNAFTQGFNARYKMQDGVESREKFMEQFKKK